MILDPGHFHAGLVLKTGYEGVDPVVHIFAPKGPDIENFINQVQPYNTREEQPTNWVTKIYKNPDYLEKLIGSHPGNVMVTSGNNREKTEYIYRCIEAGINVYADKPMAISTGDFALLEKAFTLAGQKGVLIYDIMTERFEITTMLQKAMSQMPGVFGTLVTGTPEKPAIVKQSVHHFYKYVSGSILKRPAWFFDVTQQGEGIVDVTTHLVDLVQWECYPEEIIDYKNDIEIIDAKRRPTILTPEQFKAVTRLEEYPGYLLKDVDSNKMVKVYANGEIVYRIKEVYAKVAVSWNYKAPDGTGDTHYSIMRGSKASLEIKQDAAEHYQPALYIIPAANQDVTVFTQAVNKAIENLQELYPGISVVKTGDGMKVRIPEEYKAGHEAHFGQVTEQFIEYFKNGKLPEWEVPNMLAKYYTTTKALEMAVSMEPGH